MKDLKTLTLRATLLEHVKYLIRFPTLNTRGYGIEDIWREVGLSIYIHYMAV
jgi:hypothetical protein